MKKTKSTADSSLENKKFSIQYAIRSIKYLRKSEMCRKGNQDWEYIPKKGYENKDHYECKHCHEKKAVKN